MEFEWDENKNKSNQEKHGIDFNQAKGAKVEITVPNGVMKFKIINISV